MSALRFPQGLGSAGVRMNAREYLALGETSQRYELIDGVLVMSPSPSLSHQDLIRALLRQIEPAAENLPGVRVVLDTDIQFSDDTVYRPDLCIFAKGRLRGAPEYPTAAPDLIIEVISAWSKARDLITKRDDYARFGVREYWVVDEKAAAIRIFRAARRVKKFTVPTLVRATAESVAVPGIVIDIALLRGALATGAARSSKRADKSGRERPPA